MYSPQTIRMIFPTALALRRQRRSVSPKKRRDFFREARVHKITAPDALDAIRKCLEKDGSLIVEHWFYRGSSAPDRLVFDDYEAFMEYLDSRAYAGDIIEAWSFSAACRDDNRLTSGKCPDENGLVPRRGAY